MIVGMIIIVLVLSLAGLAFLNHVVKNAVNGYEDEYGFHEGAESQSAGDFATAMHAAVIEQVSNSPRASFLARRALKRAAKMHIEKGSSVPHTG